MLVSDLETYLPQERQSAAFKVSRCGLKRDEPLRRLARFDAFCSSPLVSGWLYLEARCVFCLCVTDQVHLSPSSPGTLGHVPVCRWTRLGHGVVPHPRHGPGRPVHRSGLPSRDGRPAPCEQGVPGAWAGSAVGRGPSGAEEQVLVPHKPAGARTSPLRAALSSSAVPAPSPGWPTVWPRTKASSGI